MLIVCVHSVGAGDVDEATGALEGFESVVEDMAGPVFAAEAELVK